MTREIDEACALALGWEGVGVACMMGPYEDLYYKSHTNDGYDVVPEFSADISAARELEDEIDRQGKGAAYAQRLFAIVCGDEYDVTLYGEGDVNSRDLFNLIRATPAQRAQAFLKVVK